MLISNSSGKVAVSPITSTELGYLDNTTSNIQNQINAVTDSLSWKLAGSATGTGNITIALSTCKELLAVSTATSPHNMTIHIPPVAGYYCGSFFVTNTDNSFFRIRVQSTNVHLVVAYSCTSEGTTDVTNSTSISVYYR